MLVPGPVTGTRDTVPTLLGYKWLKQLPDKKIYLGLFQGWNDSKGRYQIQDLPTGYDYYIVSFHLETVNLPWLVKQKPTGPIIVLVDGNTYDLKIPGVHQFKKSLWRPPN